MVVFNNHFSCDLCSKSRCFYVCRLQKHRLVNLLAFIAKGSGGLHTFHTGFASASLLSYLTIDVVMGDNPFLLFPPFPYFFSFPFPIFYLQIGNGDMNPHSGSGTKPKLANVSLDITGVYVGAGH